MSHEAFFIQNGDMLVRVYTEREQWIELGTVEYLYQQFKARMMAEIAAGRREAEIRRMNIAMKMPRRKAT